MTDRTSESIKKLKELSPKLNKATDEASRILARVEAFLTDECSIGIWGAAYFDHDELDDDRRRDYWLVYGRVAGKFRIAIKEIIVEVATMREIEEDVTPWPQCPQDQKLAAFAVLPELLARIAEEVEKVSAKTTATTAAVEKIVKAMKGEARYLTD